MQFVEPDEKPSAEMPAPMTVVEDTIMAVRDAYPRLPDDAPSSEVAEAVLKALHDAGYRIAIARKQWR